MKFEVARSCFGPSNRKTVVRAPGVFNMVTSKCASCHNGVHSGVHSLDIWTSKSGPMPVCYTFCASRHNRVQICLFATFLRFRVSASSRFCLSLCLSFSIAALLTSDLLHALPPVHFVESTLYGPQSAHCFLHWQIIDPFHENGADQLMWLFHRARAMARWGCKFLCPADEGLTSNARREACVFRTNEFTKFLGLTEGLGGYRLVLAYLVANLRWPIFAGVSNIWITSTWKQRDILPSIAWWVCMVKQSYTASALLLVLFHPVRPLLQSNLYRTCSSTDICILLH